LRLRGRRRDRGGRAPPAGARLQPLLAGAVARRPGAGDREDLPALAAAQLLAALLVGQYVGGLARWAAHTDRHGSTPRSGCGTGAEGVGPVQASERAAGRSSEKPGIAGATDTMLPRPTARPPPEGAFRMKPIYLDYNATTPVDPAVVEAM